MVYCYRSSENKRCLDIIKVNCYNRYDLIIITRLSLSPPFLPPFFWNFASSLTSCVIDWRVFFLVLGADASRVPIGDPPNAPVTTLPIAASAQWHKVHTSPELLGSTISIPTNHFRSMSAYFTNSYLADLRNSSVDHYPGQSVTTPQHSPDSCDPNLRQVAAHYGSSTTQGPTYPRFPPYDRLEIRPITSGNPCVAVTNPHNGPNNPPQYYNQTQSLSALSDGQNCRNVSPPELTSLQHVPPSTHQYNSCKLQQQQPSPTSPTGPPPGPLRSQQQQQPPQQPPPPPQANLGTANHNHNLSQPQSQTSPQQQQPQQQQQQQQHVPYNVNNATNGGPHSHHPHHQVATATPTQPPPSSVAPPTQHHQNNQNGPGSNNGSLSSPLYPWMRSQFGENSVTYMYINIRHTLVFHSRHLNTWLNSTSLFIILLSLLSSSPRVISVDWKMLFVKLNGSIFKCIFSLKCLGRTRNEVVPFVLCGRLDDL